MPDDADLEAARLQSIRDNAKRLGLIWELRMATAMAEPISTENATTLVIDGDTEPIQAISMIGPLIPGARVYVITSPPSANHVVGQVGAPRIEQAPLAGTTAGATSGAALTEVAVLSSAWDVEEQVVIGAGHVARVMFTGLLIQSSGVLSAATVRIRTGQQSTTGTAIATWPTFNIPGTGGAPWAETFTGYVKNDSDSPITTFLSATIQQTVGAANFSIAGTPTTPLVISVQDVGSIAANPGFAAGAVQI